MTLSVSELIARYSGEKRLANQHPVYESMFTDWDYLRRAYLGGRHWYEAQSGVTIPGFEWRLGEDDKPTRHSIPFHEMGFLFRHELEDNAKYARRRRGSLYWNFFAPVADIRASAAAKVGGEPELPSGLEYLLEDIDSNGTNLTDWRTTVLAWAQVTGAYGYVRMPDVTEETAPTSLDDQVVRGIRPYVQTLSPVDVPDWEYDTAAKKYRFALVNERNALRRPDPGQADNKEHECWQRAWFADHWELYRNGELDSEGENPFGEVPVVPLIIWHDIECPEPVSVLAMRTVADACLRIFNLDSWMTEQHARQTFSQMAAVGKDVAKLTGETVVGIGISTILTVPGAEDLKYLSPDVAQPQELARAISECIARIRAIAGLATEGEKASGVKSAEAIALERQDLVSTLKAMASAAETFETRVFRLCGRGMRLDANEVKTKWGRNFAERDVNALLDRAITSIEKAGFKGAALTSIQKMAFDALTPDMDKDEREEAHDDIDAAAEEAEKLAQQMAEQPMNPPGDDEEDEDVTGGEDMPKPMRGNGMDHDRPPQK